MNDDAQNALYAAWPEIFRQKDLERTITSMCWGMECDNGWAGLTGAHAVLAATTVKQKLGSLRVHFNERCKFCDGARLMIEAISARVCEVSGRPGVLRGARGGGVKTLSPDIANQLGFEVERTDPRSRFAHPEVPVGWQGIVAALVGLAVNRSATTEFDFGTAQDCLRVGSSQHLDQSLLARQPVP